MDLVSGEWAPNGSLSLYSHQSKLQPPFPSLTQGDFSGRHNDLHPMTSLSVSNIFWFVAVSVIQTQIQRRMKFSRELLLDAHQGRSPFRCLCPCGEREGESERKEEREIQREGVWVRLHYELGKRFPPGTRVLSFHSGQSKQWSRSLCLPLQRDTVSMSYH